MTTTLPVVAPAGTGTVICVSLQLAGVLSVPLNVTVLVPCDEPKPPPEMVTRVPATPERGLSRVIPTGFVVAIAMLEYALTLPAASWARMRKE